MSRTELLEKIGKTAHSYERVYHGCSQSVLKALQEHLQLGGGDAFRAASAFAGGIARMGETCEHYQAGLWRSDWRMGAKN